MDTSATVRSDFATRLYDKLAGTQAGKNLFLSPFSIRVALAMCRRGRKGRNTPGAGRPDRRTRKRR